MCVCVGGGGAEHAVQHGKIPSAALSVSLFPSFCPALLLRNRPRPEKLTCSSTLFNQFSVQNSERKCHGITGFHCHILLVSGQPPADAFAE